MRPHGDKLVFNLAGEYIGIDTNLTKGIVDADRFFPVPASSPIIKGLINQQGEMIPVIDAALLLGLKAKDDLPCRVVIIKYNDILFGLSVEIKDMYFLWNEDVAKAGITSIDEGYFKILIDTGDKKINFLDCSAVIKGVEKIIKEQNCSPIYRRL